MNREKTVYNRIIKRILDIICSFMAIVFLSIIYLPICVIIKCTSKGPIFFKQKRVGKDKKYFNILKFRTMRTDTPKDCPTHLLKNPDQYITKVGKFLRKTSLDELPQIFNVVRGEMGLVGPRPYLPQEVKDMGESRDTILLVKPGITGYWQTSGRNEITFEERLHMESWYVCNWGVWIDFMLLWRTIKVVFNHKGAY